MTRKGGCFLSHHLQRRKHWTILYERKGEKAVPTIAFLFCSTRGEPRKYKNKRIVVRQGDCFVIVSMVIRYFLTAPSHVKGKLCLTYSVSLRDMSLGLELGGGARAFPHLIVRHHIEIVPVQGEGHVPEDGAAVLHHGHCLVLHSSLQRTVHPDLQRHRQNTETVRDVLQDTGDERLLSMCQVKSLLCMLPWCGSVMRRFSLNVIRHHTNSFVPVGFPPSSEVFSHFKYKSIYSSVWSITFLLISPLWQNPFRSLSLSTLIRAFLQILQRCFVSSRSSRLRFILCWQRDLSDNDLSAVNKLSAGRQSIRALAH